MMKVLLSYFWLIMDDINVIFNKIKKYSILEKMNEGGEGYEK